MPKNNKSKKIFHFPNGRIVVKEKPVKTDEIVFAFKQGKSKTVEMVEKIIQEMSERGEENNDVVRDGQRRKLD